MRITALILLLTAVSFSGYAQTDANKAKTVTAAYDYKKLQGAYTGNFGGSEIRIVLERVDGAHASGYNVHKELKRTMTGGVTYTQGIVTFLLKEPGDNKFDGIFNFTVDTSTFVLSGTWTPMNNKSLSQSAYTLKKI